MAAESSRVGSDGFRLLGADGSTPGVALWAKVARQRARLKRAYKDTEGKTGQHRRQSTADLSNSRSLGSDEARSENPDAGWGKVCESPIEICNSPSYRICVNILYICLSARTFTLWEGGDADFGFGFDHPKINRESEHPFCLSSFWDDFPF